MEYTAKALWGDVTIKLIEGNIIDMGNGISVEIGPNNTMRGLRNGCADPKGFQPIVEQAVKTLCMAKFQNAKGNSSKEIIAEMQK